MDLYEVKLNLIMIQQIRRIVLPEKLKTYVMDHRKREV